MHKKGQTEDIFNDLIPALILIVIAVVIIAINSSSEKEEVSERYSLDLSSLRQLDLFTYMRMPVLNHNSFSEFIIDLDSGKDSAKEFTEGIDPYTCNDKLSSELRGKITVSYKQWSLRAFDASSGNLVFACYSDDSFFIDAYRLTNVDVQEALYGASLYRDFEQAYFSPFGMKYLGVTLPTSDPSRNLFVKMGVMLDE